MRYQTRLKSLEKTFQIDKKKWLIIHVPYCKNKAQRDVIREELKNNFLKNTLKYVITKT